MPSPLIVPGGRPTAEQIAADPDPTLPPEPIECTVAFTVYHDLEGEWRVADIDSSLHLGRPVTFDDMTAAAAVILRVEEPGIEYHREPFVIDTAFVIYQLPNGLWQASNELSIPLVPGRTPVPTDVIGGLAVTARDAQTREIAALVIPQVAEAVVARQFQIGQAIREQAEAAKVQQQLEADERRRAGRQ